MRQPPERISLIFVQSKQYGVVRLSTLICIRTVEVKIEIHTCYVCKKAIKQSIYRSMVVVLRWVTKNEVAKGNKAKRAG